jgi:uncharacterized protein (UPF0261 family)
MGGLQNTIIGARAMQRLPIGVPKLLVSTVASGQRTFDPMVGTRDVTIMSSVADLAGLNRVSKTVLANATAAMAGMVHHAGKELPRPSGITVGTTLMGATNDGVDRAARFLELAGLEVVAFHSTGAGGRALEELIDQGVITAVLDLTLHEIVYEHFGCGFGFGAGPRLTAGARCGLPMVICPGGIDFICQWNHELFSDIDSRQMIWHNAQLAHVKLRPNEILAVCGLITTRLNQATGPVTVLLPRAGLRSFTKPGEPLHDPKLDQLVFNYFESNLKKSIPVKYVEASIMDQSFSRQAADELLNLLKVEK